MRPSFPRPTRSTVGRLAAVALLALGAAIASCAGETLPDAPNPPRARRTPPPDFFDPSPDPSASPGAPTPTPRPSGALPPAPREGQIVRTGSNYLEFLEGSQAGKLLFYAFPYDARVQGIRGSVSEAAATLKIDGTASKMSPYLDEDGNLFFYLFPKVSPGSHQIEISAKVKNVDYSGTFTYP